MSGYLFYEKMVPSGIFGRSRDKLRFDGSSGPAHLATGWTYLLKQRCNFFLLACYIHILHGIAMLPSLVSFFLPSGRNCIEAKRWYTSVKWENAHRT